MNMRATAIETQADPVRQAGRHIARAAAMFEGIERLSMLLEEGCSAEAFGLVTAIQACAAQGAVEMSDADATLWPVPAAEECSQ